MTQTIRFPGGKGRTGVVVYLIDPTEIGTADILLASANAFELPNPHGQSTFSADFSGLAIQEYRITAVDVNGLTVYLGFCYPTAEHGVSNAYDASDKRLRDIYDLLYADEYIDTAVTPWAHVYMKQGTGGIGVGTELLRKQIKDTAGADLTSTATIPGQKVDNPGTGT